MNKKIEFEEFLASVSEQNQEFVKELHNQLMESGCKIEIKSAKSGYMVSYLYHKKTIANYVFRKKGMLARIYGVHVNAVSYTHLDVYKRQPLVPMPKGPTRMMSSKILTTVATAIK